MVLVKLVKNNAYFKKFQVKYRRRREGKTDFGARKLLIKQDRNKYNTPKYRLVVRLSNTKVIVQVVWSTITGDRVECAANSTELKQYGITFGLTNYAAAYATGLLCARRMLKKLNLESSFTGKESADGEEFHIEEEDCDRKPFKVLLDIGLRRTTIGAKPFAAMKGAVDGGLHVPHSVKRFPGYKASEGKDDEGSYDAEAHKDRILCGHVAEYMKMMQEDDPEKYKAHFSRFLKAGVTPDKIKKLYTEAHKKIRANPGAPAKKDAGVTYKRTGTTVTPSAGKPYPRALRLTLEQRRAGVQERIQAAVAKMQASADE